MAGHVLDTSAIIAYLYDEPGSDIAEAVIFGGSEIRIPFIALMEVEYKFHRELGDELEVAKSMAALNHWPTLVVESDLQWRQQAARVKARGKLSLADAWVAALALINDATLVHKDPEFETVANLKDVKLPYDRDARGRGR